MINTGVQRLDGVTIDKILNHCVSEEQNQFDVVRMTLFTVKLCYKCISSIT